MPTVDDAVALVTDRKYAIRPRTTDPVEMRATAMVSALQRLGADEVTARGLISEAAQRLGGGTEIEHHRGGLRAGGPQMRSRFRVWMPASTFSTQAEWWGVLEPEHSTAAVAERARAAGIHLHGDQEEGFTLRWPADDLDDAIRTIHDAAGVHPAHFRSGYPKSV